MKRSVDIIVVIPIGPGSDNSFVADTINSYIHYTKRSYQFILLDDSHQGIGAQVNTMFPDADLIKTSKPMGGWAGLYISLAQAFAFALENYQFKLLLKLDTDALIINSAPEKEALQLFEKEPLMGIAGQYPLNYNGDPWDLGWPRRRILNGTTTWKFIRRPYANWYLRKLYLKALANGYRTGESVFGGAYFLSEKSLSKLRELGLLPDYKLQTLNLGEDHIFALLVKSIGFQLGSLSQKDQPFACSWKGLPAAPDKLSSEGRKIIHSTRYWEDMNEKDIRDWFYKKRQDGLGDD